MNETKVNGELMRRLIEKSGLSVEELSEKTGVGQRHIRELMNGRSVNPYAVQFIDLCYAIGAEPIQLIRLEGKDWMEDASREAHKRHIAEIMEMLTEEDLATLEKVAEMSLAYRRNEEHNRKTRELRQSRREGR